MFSCQDKDVVTTFVMVSTLDSVDFIDSNSCRPYIRLCSGVVCFPVKCVVTVTVNGILTFYILVELLCIALRYFLMRFLRYMLLRTCNGCGLVSQEAERPTSEITVVEGIIFWDVCPYQTMRRNIPEYTYGTLVTPVRTSNLTLQIFGITGF
jgi:hypothetical protein